MADGMRVWIDQDLCTGDGLCAEIAPEIFTMLDDGLAYVRGAGKVVLHGSEGTRDLLEAELPGAIESAEECPGECIFIEER